MKYHARIGELQREFTFERSGGHLVARCGGQTLDVDVAMIGDGEAISLVVDGISYDVAADVQRDQVTVQVRGERFVVQVQDERELAANAVAAHKAGGKRQLNAAMPGIVVEVLVAVGAEVEEGQALVVLEAMKMQNPLCAEGPGRVTRITAVPGQAVAAGALLVEIE